MGLEGEAMLFTLLVAILWIGWPLMRIASHLEFIVKQIKERP